MGTPPDPEAELEELRRENAMLRETLDAIEGSVVVYDRDQRYLFGNAAYHALFPHLPGDDVLRGEHYADILNRSIDAGSVPDPLAYTDRAAFVAARAEDMRRPDAEPREVFNTRPGREVFHKSLGRWFLLRSRRTPSNSRVTLRVDITALKRLQGELTDAREAAETASRMKSQFLANITHELRTPLNAVINFAQLMIEQIHGPLGAASYRDYAREIESGGRQLLALIEELLDLARAEAGRLTIVEGTADPAAIIQAAVSMMQPQATAQDVALAATLPRTLPLIRGDAGRLRQVLLNLVDNALKFTAPGGAVQIDAAEDEQGLLIAVTDSGAGIPAGDMNRIMEPFEQADTPMPTQRRPGIGLGLPLARHLVELHDGTLELTSRESRGTAATIRLPTTRLLPRRS
jgi:two-component system, cell cycle sensor histidine kinase PleC